MDLKWNLISSYFKLIYEKYALIQSPPNRKVETSLIGKSNIVPLI